MNRGYVAIASVLIISALMVIIGSTIAILSIDQGLTSLSAERSWETLNLVGGCTEEALLRFTESGTVASTITLPSNTCTTSTNTQSGANVKFSLTGTTTNHTRHFYLDITRSLPFTINLRVEN